MEALKFSNQGTQKYHDVILECSTELFFSSNPYSAWLPLFTMSNCDSELHSLELSHMTTAVIAVSYLPELLTQPFLLISLLH